MSYFSEQTTAINGKIAALKAVKEKVKGKYDRMVSEAKTLMDSIMEIYKQLGGYVDMIKSIETILSTKLEDIEETIKSAIKIALKNVISCGIEPTIDDSLILTGVTFNISKLDPMSILSIDPTSENGTYGYFDNLTGIESRDFNVFLYTLIKKSINNPFYSGATWNIITKEDGENIKVPLFKATYQEYDPITMESNILTIKIDSAFKGQTLSYFISQYLDSVRLFNNVQIISSIFDDILGTKILSINKTTEQIAVEKQIEEIVDNILNKAEDENEVIDDSFYTFSNDVYSQILENAEKKKRGVFTYDQKSNTEIEVDQELILDSLNGLKIDNLLVSEQTKILVATIDNIANDLESKSEIKSGYGLSFKTDFITKIINKLMTTISMTILSPKIIFLFSMTTKIFGIEDEKDAIDFIKSNINVYKIIIIGIRDIIMQELIKQIKEMLTPMIESMMLELTKEKFAIYKKQLKTITSLIGL